SDANASAVSISLSCDDGSVTDSPQNASDNPDSPAVFTVTGVRAAENTSEVHARTAPVGHTERDDCGAVVLAANGASSCTITNTPTPAPYTTLFRSSDANASAVSISLSCDDGSVTDSPQNASDNPDSPAVFTVTGV